MVRNDRWIARMALERGLIRPFSGRVAGPSIASYGLQPAGYDARLDPRILVLNDALIAGKTLDPLDPDQRMFTVKIADPHYDIPPHTFVEGMTVERFKIPRTCIARGVGKTVYAAHGVSLNIASINPGWEGRLRLHIANTSSVSVRIYGAQGIVHLQFEEIESPDMSYDELRETRFQGQDKL
ncbi:MAG: dCTP deaminase [Patescibacteria group bacterium]